MGNCNDSGKSRTFTLDELKDLKIGEKKEMGKGCGPRVSGTQGGSCYAQLVKRGFGWPKNGEFNWGGMGRTCNMCSNVSKGYGCDNCSGSKAIGGNRGTVTRIAYLGDQNQCCQQQKVIIGDKTCDPKYIDQYKTDVCDVYMKDYCVGDVLSKDECQKWIHTALDNNRSTPNVPLKTYCSTGSNFATPTCQKWCDKVKNIPSMAGECDQAVEGYCKNNTTDPLCTCMHPPENVSKAEGLISSSKVCWYRPCKELTNDNYISSTMRDQKKSCVSTVCTIDTGDIQVSGESNKIEFTNNCASNILKEPTPEEKKQTEDAKDEKKPEETKPVAPEVKSSSSSIVIISLLILIVIGLIASYFIFRKSMVGGIVTLVIVLILIIVMIYLSASKPKT